VLVTLAAACTLLFWLHLRWGEATAAAAGGLGQAVGAGVPEYVRVVLFGSAVLNMLAGLTHWLMKPFGGLQRVAGIELGGRPCKKKDLLLVAIQANEGVERVFASATCLYIAIAAAEYTFLMLCLCIFKQLCVLCTTRFYMPLKGSVKGPYRAPGEYRSMPLLLLPLSALLVAVAAGDVTLW